jgi:hypothetical protein
MDDLKTVVKEVFEDWAGRAQEMIQADWPDATGESRRGWKVTPTEDGWEITNDVPYAKYIHRKGESEPVYDQIVMDNLDILEPYIMDDLADRIAQLDFGGKE